MNFFKTYPTSPCFQDDGFCGVLAEHALVDIPLFLSMAIAITACIVLLFNKNRVRYLTVASIVASGLGYALSFLAGFLIKLPYVFMAGNLIARFLRDKSIRLNFDKTRTETLLLIFWGLALVSILYTFQAPYLNVRSGNMFLHGLPIRTIIQNMQLAFMLCFFYVTHQYCKDRENWRQIIRFFSLCTLIGIGYGGYELLTLYVPGIPYLNLSLPAGMAGGYRTGSDATIFGGKLYRMHGYFNEPAGMACYLLFAVPLLMADASVAGRAKKPLKIILLIAGILALWLTSSNAAFVAAAAGGISVLFFVRNWKAMVFAAVIFLGVPWTAQKLMSKMAAAESGQQESLIVENLNRTFTEPNYRYTVWREAFEVFKKKPVLGIGLGNYSFWFDTQSMEGTSSLFMQILVELGSVGMLVFLLFVGSIVWDLWRLVLERPDAETHVFALAMIGALAAGLVDRMSFDALTSDPLLWVLLGMAAALPRIPREETVGVHRELSQV